MKLQTPAGAARAAPLTNVDNKAAAQINAPPTSGGMKASANKDVGVG